MAFQQKTLKVQGLPVGGIRRLWGLKIVELNIYLRQRQQLNAQIKQDCLKMKLFSTVFRIVGVIICFC